MKTFSPQEAAVVAEVPLSTVQKAITAGHLPPAGTATAGGRRLIDERSVLALALVRAKPKAVTLALREARERLADADLDQALHLGAGGVLDLPRLLAEPRRRMALLERGSQLVGEAGGRRTAKIKGTEIGVEELLGHVAAGSSCEAVAAAYPALARDDVEAVIIWGSANPSRGRPPKQEAPAAVTASVPVVWSKVMRIAASQIDAWAGRRDSQGDLPILVRRLIHASSAPAAVAMPGGDSIMTPGWDGVVEATATSAWVPHGRSVWELSCDAGPTSKANQDLLKRTEQTSAEERARTAYVFATARRWPGKAKWLKASSSFGWAEVRAYDADDLEQWLEQSPATALWFGDLIGLTGHGVVSLGAFWATWADQCDPRITYEAVFGGRERQRDGLLEAVRKRLAANDGQVLSLMADSSEEGAAFAAAALMASPDLGFSGLVVTSPEGWRFVEQNPLVRVAVAAAPELVDRPPQRPGLVVIVPCAAGDMADQRHGAAVREEAEITLDRPNVEALEKALIAIGMDRGDARRLVVSTGRSWSVIRRRRSTNPAIRQPAWLSGEHTQALSTVCLLGSWSSNHDADRALVERLAGRPYDDLERDLLWLARLGDAPVIQIGGVWKAKSPLELLDLFGGRITRGELERFFEIATALLESPDPALDLPEENRHAPGFYGKERAESELLRRAVCDTLVKLAVRGPSTELARLSVDAKVEALVRNLLHDADEIRWLSLHDELPALAEAAPDAFLDAVNASLRAPGKPITRLLTETGDSTFMSRCWHAGLLWALELLAWAPERLPRVSLVLAALSHVEIKGNWGNSPKSSLMDFFRSWFPQTSAPLEQRIRVLDALIKQEPDVAADLLDRIAYVGHDSADHTHRPAWRDDDAGSGYGVPWPERHGMLVAAVDRQIALSAGHPRRLAKLVEKVDMLDDPLVLKIVELVRAFSSAEHSDVDRELLRAALRDRIHWRKNFGDKKADGFKRLGELEKAYAALEPKDLVVRHEWLFADGWPKLPQRDREEDFSGRGQRVTRARDKALAEIVAAEGFAGVERLAAGCRSTGHIGAALARGSYGEDSITDWLIERAADLSPADPMAAVAWGLFRSDEERSPRLLDLAFKKARSGGWAPERLARLLVQAPEQSATWKLAEGGGAEVERQYWEQCNPGLWLCSGTPDFEVALRRLIAAGRPQTALQACHLEMKKVQPQLLFELLEKLLVSPEEGVQFSSWHVREAVRVLEASKAIDRLALARLEFGLMPVLSIDAPGCATSLYEAITSDPKLFTELITLLYRPKGEPRVERSKAEAHAATNAWQVLHQCKRIPGIRADGTIDADEFGRFASKARELCDEAGRLEACDITLGEILAHAPGDEDGTWPCAPVRDLLDLAENAPMRRGFGTGVFNKRGVFSKSLTEGGLQERALADHFRAHARKLQHSHVHLASALERIAKSYDDHAKREDQEAQLRMEGY